MVCPAVAGFLAVFQTSVPELVPSWYAVLEMPQTAGGCTVFLDTNPGLLSVQKNLILFRFKMIKGTY